MKPDEYNSDLYGRFAPQFFDSMNRIGEMLANSSFDAVVGNPFWEQSGKLFNPPLMEKLAAMEGLAARVSSTLTPALLNACRVNEALTQQMLGVTRDIASPSESLATAFQPLLDAIHRGDPLEADIMGLARALQGQSEDEPEDGSEEALDADADDGDEEAAVEAVNEILQAEPKNWEQKLVEKLKDAGNRRPVQAWLIKCILSIIIQIMVTIIAELVVEAIKPAVLREDPTPAASIVVNVDASRHMTVVNKVRYYYQVAYTDPETGERHTGWISKRSTRPIQLEEGD